MRSVVIHGHFYQPPREEPWLELMPREISAAPYHDWNERITAECYRPLARAPVTDAAGRIVQVINCYAWCSFDVGPTLFRWLDEHAVDVGEAIRAGDRESRQRVGFGNAVAMPYHHVILPLLSRRDQITEVRWGIKDFRARFGREPEGMWLPETACDDDTLAVLAGEGIRFTILAPSQMQQQLPAGRPGRWSGAGGRELALFAYDGPAAHQVAFGDALDSVARWETSLLASGDATGSDIISIATDGETFGHHHRFGDIALAALIDRISLRSDATLTNYSAILDAERPIADVAIVSPSSWSCPHGVERWRSECGCRFEAGTSQAWRAPLREGLEQMAASIREVVSTDWPVAAGDRWERRDQAGPDLSGVPELPAEARRLLEIERHVLAMFTSCAWFFDDLGRLEPRIVLRHAARALDFLPSNERDRLESALLATLVQARSSDPAKGSGAAIWERDIISESAGPARLAAGLAALRELSPDALDDVRMPAHDWRLDGDTIVVRHRRTGRECGWRTEPETLGVLAVRTRVSAGSGRHGLVVGIADYPLPIRSVLRVIAAPLIFAAALGDADSHLFRAGLLDPASARARALAGAWQLIERDGLVSAAVVLHGVIDLFDLDCIRPDDTARAEAFIRLGAFPPSHERKSLAQRFGLEFSPR
ncbi:MAG: DUF3536 domain-containing protein [Gemmatimonadales bacterium]